MATDMFCVLTPQPAHYYTEIKSQYKKERDKMTRKIKGLYICLKWKCQRKSYCIKLCKILYKGLHLCMQNMRVFFFFLRVIQVTRVWYNGPKVL